MKRFSIIPTNEGQDLNYLEQHKGTKTSAVARAEELIQQLKPVLKQGDIGCRVEDSEGNVVFSS